MGVMLLLVFDVTFILVSLLLLADSFELLG